MLIVILLALGIPLAASPLSVTHSARAIRPGEVVVLRIADAAEPPEVRAFERSWPPYPDGARTWRALIGIDLDTRPGRYDVVVTSGDSRVSHPLVVVPRTFPTRRLTVDPALVNPPPEAR